MLIYEHYILCEHLVLKTASNLGNPGNYSSSSQTTSKLMINDTGQLAKCCLFFLHREKVHT